MGEQGVRRGSASALCQQQDLGAYLYHCIFSKRSTGLLSRWARALCMMAGMSWGNATRQRANASSARHSCVSSCASSTRAPSTCWEPDQALNIHITYHVTAKRILHSLRCTSMLSPQTLLDKVTPMQKEL